MEGRGAVDKAREAGCPVSGFGSRATSFGALSSPAHRACAMTKKRNKDGRNQNTLSCDLCNIPNIGYDALMSHKAGKTHKQKDKQRKAAQRNEEIQCAAAERANAGGPDSGGRSRGGDPCDRERDRDRHRDRDDAYRRDERDDYIGRGDGRYSRNDSGDAWGASDRGPPPPRGGGDRDWDDRGRDYGRFHDRRGAPRPRDDDGWRGGFRGGSDYDRARGAAREYRSSSLSPERRHRVRPLSPERAHSDWRDYDGRGRGRERGGGQGRYSPPPPGGGDDSGRRRSWEMRGMRDAREDRPAPNEYGREGGERAMLGAGSGALPEGSVPPPQPPPPPMPFGMPAPPSLPFGVSMPVPFGVPLQAPFGVPVGEAFATTPMMLQARLPQAMGTMFQQAGAMPPPRPPSAPAFQPLWAGRASQPPVSAPPPQRPHAAPQPHHPMSAPPPAPPPALPHPFTTLPGQGADVPNPPMSMELWAAFEATCCGPNSSPEEALAFKILRDAYLSPSSGLKDADVTALGSVFTPALVGLVRDSSGAMVKNAGSVYIIPDTLPHCGLNAQLGVPKGNRARNQHEAGALDRVSTMCLTALNPSYHANEEFESGLRAPGRPPHPSDGNIEQTLNHLVSEHLTVLGDSSLARIGCEGDVHFPFIPLESKVKPRFTDQRSVVRDATLHRMLPPQFGRSVEERVLAESET